MGTRFIPGIGEVQDISQQQIQEAAVGREAAAAVILTKYAFLNRFTMEERITFREAAKTNPILFDGNELLNLATEVNLTDVNVQRLIGYMAQVGILTAERAGEILTP